MEETIVLDQLTERVSNLENEVSGLRQEVGALRQQTAPVNGAGIQFVDQAELSRTFKQLFAELGITAQPKGVAYLRQMYEAAGITDLQLSRCLVEARDE